VSLVETERVLVVPTEVFHRLGQFQGFCGEVDRYLAGLLDDEHVSYRPRGEMEEDPSFKQLIPYVIFRHVDADGRSHVFQYTRGGGMGEGRLHSKRSIGVGGHISSIDAEASPSGQPYEEGMRRELDEEVRVETKYRQECVGLINDDDNPVGQVHLGVVHICDVETPDVYPREDEILDAGFRDVEELLADLEHFETWSQICLRALFTK
jgi:predicted NUDIX family phosphoesterase